MARQFRMIVFVSASIVSALLVSVVGGPASIVWGAAPSLSVKSDRSRPHLALPDSVHDHIAEALKNNQSKDEAFPTVTGRPEPEKFVDMCQIGGVLVGFDLCYGVTVFNSPIIAAYRPYYVTKKGKRPGNWRGNPNENITHLEAKPGYVVGSVTLAGGIHFHNVSVRYMKLTTTGIDTADSYDSPCYGGPSQREPETIGGDGRLIVGLGGQVLLLGGVPNFGGITVPAMPK